MAACSSCRRCSISFKRCKPFCWATCRFSILFLAANTSLVKRLINCSVSRIAFSFNWSLKAITSWCFAWISDFNKLTTASWSAISSASFSRFLARPIFLPSNKPILPPESVYFPFTYFPDFSRITAPVPAALSKAVSCVAINTLPNRYSTSLEYLPSTSTTSRARIVSAGWATLPEYPAKASSRKKLAFPFLFLSSNWTACKPSCKLAAT